MKTDFRRHEACARTSPDQAPDPGVMILCAQLAALSLVRRLGQAGIPAGCADTRPDAPASDSRYCRQTVLLPENPDGWLDRLRRAAAEGRLGERPVLLATSDETLLWMSHHREDLAAGYRLLLPPRELLQRLVDKRRLYELAAAHQVPTPRSLPVGNLDELSRAAASLGFPCLLKSAYSKPGGRDPALGKVLVRNAGELESAYARMEGLDRRLLLQEYIPGDCRQVLLYNAYFGADGQPVAIFTGRKRRQYPPEFGTASLTETCPLPGLAMQMTRFFEQLGFIGPVDCGLKFDARRGEALLLDVNPRLGQNYRAWLGRDDVDLGWLAYREAAGTAWPAYFSPLAAMRERLWVIEDNDWRSRRRLRKQGAPQAMTRLADYAGVRGTAYWNWRDPRPAWRKLCQLWQQRRQETSWPREVAHADSKFILPQR